MSDSGTDLVCSSEERLEREEPFVFLSSLFQEEDSEKHRYSLGIRKRLWEFGRSSGIPVWAADNGFTYPKSFWDGKSPLEKIDLYVDALYRARVVVCILTRRHGSLVEITPDAGAYPTSYFEVELFHASLGRKPIIVCQIDGYEPEAELRAIEDLLAGTVPRNRWIRGSESDVAGNVCGLLRGLGDGTRDWAQLNVASRAGDALAAGHDAGPIAKTIASSNYSLLERFRPRNEMEFSQSRVAQALELPATSFRSQATRLWLAIRELSKLSVPQINDEIAGYWMEVAGGWSSVAAWMGLHGDLQLGVLAGLHTQVALTSAGKLDAPFPYGPLASEQYSIGKRCDGWYWRRRKFALAGKLASLQLAYGSGDPSGSYGVRASAHLQLALLGLPHHALLGLNDYRHMLDYRERHAQSPSSLGEAEVEYGFCLFYFSRVFPWLRKSSLDHIERGISLMRSDSGIARAGFLIRGLRKAAQVYGILGDRDRAIQLEAEARNLAQSSGAYDQLRQMSGK
jgi:hypothetical protein